MTDQASTVGRCTYFSGISDPQSPILTIPPDQIGFVGLGRMGSILARHLLNDGLKIQVYNRSPDSTDMFRQIGGGVAPDLSSIGKGSDIIILCVSDGEACREILTDLEKSLVPGKLVVNLSTIHPDEAEELNMKLKALGVDYIDAAFTGGDVGASSRTLYVIAAGERACFDKALPTLQRFSKTVAYAGPVVGLSQIFKAINQTALAVSMLALGEALNLAQCIGLDGPSVLEMLKGGAADSWAIREKGHRILSGDFTSGHSVESLLKDVNIALDWARKIDTSLPALELCREQLQEAMSKNQGEKGHQIAFTGQLKDTKS